MANVVVVGAQWGDEGKGKIVDWLSERADVIARFQGGHNAGHTLVIGEKVFKLSLLPSGIVRQGKLAVIGNGVVLDPWALFSEIDKLAGQGVAISTANLMIAENTPLILPLHQDLDRLREDAAGASKIGTVFLYFLIACIGMQMDFTQLFDRLELIAIGVIWMTVHVLVIWGAARLVRAPMFYIGVGSMGNVGAAASAPVIAAAFHPTLAPVGVLLGTVGYATGTVVAYFTGQLLRLMAGQ